MRLTRLLTGFLLGLALIGMAATYYPGGMGRFYGDSTLTNLHSGAVYYNTSNSTFWVGDMTSNAVKVGDASWSNSVTASVTNGLATTNYVYPRLWLATNAWLQVHSDGTNLLWIVSTNGTLNVSNVVSTTALP